MGRPLTTRFDVWQVHGREVVCAHKPRPPEQPHRKADAILTDRATVTLIMRFADCVPILLYHPRRRVVGLVHAGWQGTVQGAVVAAVERLHSVYEADPAELWAFIGPAIGPDHYEVGADVAAQVYATFGGQATTLLRPHGTRWLLDLWSANRLLLQRVGVRRIEIAGVCTACHLEDWYSHRAERGRTGRFGAVIALPD